MAKKNKKVVVDRTYFTLIERKAALLDTLFDGSDNRVAVGIAELKEWGQIEKVWAKADASRFEGSEEEYEEPKES